MQMHWKQQGTAAILADLFAMAALPDLRAEFTPQRVGRLFPATPMAHIVTNLPFVLDALAFAGLGDRDMILMALATIRAETETFEPVSEDVSRFNTSAGGRPFDLYDSRKDLGNLGPPDGADFRGRGYVQLTGRANYARYAAEIGRNLIGSPALANDAAVAAELLAHFLLDREAAIRRALAANHLSAARRLVNGGTNGLARFQSAFEVGRMVFV